VCSQAVKSREQYAFYLDDRVVEAKSQGELYENTQDFLQRSPTLRAFWCARAP
jgi:hypothetical protein